jgi:hypothetical protein
MLLWVRMDFLEKEEPEKGVDEEEDDTVELVDT